MSSSQRENASDSELESDEEERFFSQPPEPDEEHTSPSLDLLPRTAPRSPAELAVREVEISRIIMRRAQLRRRVALWLGAGSSLMLFAALFRHHAGARAIAPEPHVAVTSMPPAVAPSLPSTQAVLALPAPSAAPEATSVALAPEATAPSSSASELVNAPSDAGKLLERASKMLSAGHTRDGVASARAAIAQDPLDARAYVLLAAGLEDLGDWAGARAAFLDCRKQATHGPSSTCAYFARR